MEFEAFDGKVFNTEDEMYDYEKTVLRRQELPLTIQDAVKYFVSDTNELMRVIEYELPMNCKAVTVNIEFPSWVVCFSLDEGSTFHLKSQSEAHTFLSDYIDKTLDCLKEDI